MTIRETIDGLMATPAEQEAFKNDRSGYLDEHDLGDVPDELIDTAFVHYADTTSIENADALAPLVTRVGPVPFEETDLPDGVTDELGAGDPPDPWSMLTFDTATEEIVDEVESDPADLDDTVVPETIEETTADPAAPDFGAGDASITDGFGDDDLGDDPFFDEADGFAAPTAEAASAAEEVTIPEVETGFEDTGDFADSLVEDVADDLDEIDPADLDFGE